MALDPLTAGLTFATKTLDKIFPDKTEAAKAKLKLAELSQAGELEELKIGMSAIIAEAKSNDPWTSRARPSFLYVMYIMILFAIPMGILSAFRPEIALQISNGIKGYLNAIPSYMWQTFGLGYSGYAIARSYDKKPNRSE